MGLQRQAPPVALGNGPAHSRRRGAARQDGYAMAALLTMVAVMSILLSAALPVWRHEMRREREAELVFRGEQYARAVGLFNRKFRNYPPNFDVLVEQKFLRKKYKDPITGKDFRPIYVGGLASAQQQPQQRPGIGSQPMQSAQPPASLGSGAQPRGGVGGGIMGVTSQSDDDSIRIYKGRTKYNQWQFVYAQAAARPGGPAGQPRPGGPGGMGRPGRPGQPGPGGGPGPGGLRPGGAAPRPGGMRPPITRPPGG
jgi:type II secretory pathway pseudopilin PulG